MGGDLGWLTIWVESARMAAKRHLFNISGMDVTGHKLLYLGKTWVNDTAKCKAVCNVEFGVDCAPTHIGSSQLGTRGPGLTEVGVLRT